MIYTRITIALVMLLLYTNLENQPAGDLVLNEDGQYTFSSCTHTLLKWVCCQQELEEYDCRRDHNSFKML